MSAESIHQVVERAPAIPKTIDAIAAALAAAKRMAFYVEVGKTTAAEVEGVLERWWMEATLDQMPGREQRVADVLAGRGLVPLEDLADAG